MIPDHIIDKAKHAIHRATGQHLGRTWEETPQWYRVGVTEEARAALEAVAANIWDQGHQTRVQRGPDECTCNAWNEDECACGNYGTGPITTPNPYKVNP